MEFPELDQAVEKINAKRADLKALMDEARNDAGELDASKVKSMTLPDGTALAEVVREKNDEIDALAKDIEDMREVAKAAGHAYADPDEPFGTASSGAYPKTAKSLGELFVNSEAFTGWSTGMKEGPAANVEIDVRNTLFETGTGWAPDTVRAPRVVESAQQRLRVVDLIPTTTTSQTSVTYMEETTFTNNAAETAEGGTKPEAALALTERTEPVRKIAVWLPVTDEQLEDVPRVRQYLDNRLGFMVRQRLDGQILVGDGTAPNLSGILDRSGIQTQAKSTDPTPDAVYKAMTKVRVTGAAEPDGAVFHPNDWQDIRLLRTADGIYIWGSPADAGPDRIWGLPVVVSTAITENTGLVGAFQPFTELAIRSGLSFQVSNSHSTYFVENKQAIRAEMRAAFIVYRPAAFCSVTGI